MAGLSRVCTRDYVTHVISSPRISCFSRATLKSWVEPGDEAKANIHCLSKFNREKTYLELIVWLLQRNLQLTTTLHHQIDATVPCHDNFTQFPPVDPSYLQTIYPKIQNTPQTNSKMVQFKHPSPTKLYTYTSSSIQEKTYAQQLHKAFAHGKPPSGLNPGIKEWISSKTSFAVPSKPKETVRTS